MLYIIDGGTLRAATRDDASGMVRGTPGLYLSYILAHRTVDGRREQILIGDGTSIASIPIPADRALTRVADAGQLWLERVDLSRVPRGTVFAIWRGERQNDMAMQVRLYGPAARLDCVEIFRGARRRLYAVWLVDNPAARPAPATVAARAYPAGSCRRRW